MSQAKIGERRFIHGTAEIVRVCCDEFEEHHWRKGICLTCGLPEMDHQLQQLDDELQLHAEVQLQVADAVERRKGESPSKEKRKLAAAEKAEKARMIRERVLEEIVSTEERYLGSLTALLANYVVPLESSITNSSKRTSSKTLILNKQEHNTLFSNIAHIRNLSAEFLASLQARREGRGELDIQISQLGAEIFTLGSRIAEEDDDYLLPFLQNRLCELNYELMRKCELRERKKEENKENDNLESSFVGDLFVKFADFFKMYNIYVMNHEAATKLLEQLMKRSRFVVFDAKCMSNPTSDGTALSSYLIMPIQRVPRYSLLLRELQKWTTDDHGDAANIRTAVTKIVKVATFINDAVRERESRDRVLAIQQKFTSGGGDFLCPGRLFCRQGAIGVMPEDGHQKVKQHEFFLFNDLLVKATVKGKYYKEIARLPLDHLFEVDDLNEQGLPCAFRVSTERHVFTLIANDDATKQAWVSELREVKEEQMKRLATLCRSPRTSIVVERRATATEDLSRLSTRSLSMSLSAAGPGSELQTSFYTPTMDSPPIPSKRPSRSSFSMSSAGSPPSIPSLPPHLAAAAAAAAAEATNLTSTQLADLSIVTEGVEESVGRRSSATRMSSTLSRSRVNSCRTGYDEGLALLTSKIEALGECMYGLEDGSGELVAMQQELLGLNTQLRTLCTQRQSERERMYDETISRTSKGVVGDSTNSLDIPLPHTLPHTLPPIVRQISEQPSVVNKDDESARTEWEKDNARDSCAVCGGSFRLTVRRHHCRACGLLVCGSCSSHKDAVAGYAQPQRTCRKCHVQLSTSGAPQGGR